MSVESIGIWPGAVIYGIGDSVKNLRLQVVNGTSPPTNSTSVAMEPIFGEHKRVPPGARFNMAGAVVKFVEIPSKCKWIESVAAKKVFKPGDTATIQELRDLNKRAKGFDDKNWCVEAPRPPADYTGDALDIHSLAEIQVIREQFACKAGTYPRALVGYSLSQNLMGRGPEVYAREVSQLLWPGSEPHEQTVVELIRTFLKLPRAERDQLLMFLAGQTSEMILYPKLIQDITAEITSIREIYQAVDLPVAVVMTALGCSYVTEPAYKDIHMKNTVGETAQMLMQLVLGMYCHNRIIDIRLIAALVVALSSPEWTPTPREYALWFTYCCSREERPNVDEIAMQMLSGCPRMLTLMDRSRPQLDGPQLLVVGFTDKACAVASAPQSGIRATIDQYYDPELLDGQLLLWHLRTAPPPVRPVALPTYAKRSIDYLYDAGWLSGFLGAQALEVDTESGTIPVEGFMNVHDPRGIPTIIRSYSAGDDELSDEQKLDAIHQFNQRFREGMRVKHCPDTLQILAGKIFRRMPDEKILCFKVDAVGNETLVEDLSIPAHMTGFVRSVPADEHVMIDVPLATYVPLSFVINTSTIMQNADAIARRIISELPPVVYRRVRHFMNTRDPAIDISPGKYVYDEDAIVYQVLCAFCCIYPVAIQQERSLGRFKIVNSTAYCWISDTYFKAEDAGGVTWNLPDIVPYSRVKDHQLICINALRNSTKSANILWLPVGSGKTFIIGWHIKELSDAGRLPRYVIWTTVPEARDDSIAQLERMGFRCTILSATKDGSLDFHEGYVNVIVHDHVKSLTPEHIAPIMPHAMFVVDEFHKCMSESQRSEVVQDLATGAARVLFASGTLIKDEKSPGELTEFLKRTVDFFVTTNNFKTALSTVVTAKVEMPCLVYRNSYHHPKPYFAMAHLFANFYRELSKGVLMVTKKREDSDTLRQLLIEVGVEPSRIVIYTRQNVRSYGPELDRVEGRPGYIPQSSHLPKVIIVDLMCVSGYNMPRYPNTWICDSNSNAATVEQVLGRCDRVNNEGEEVYRGSTRRALVTKLVFYDNPDLYARHARVRMDAEKLSDLSDGANEFTSRIISRDRLEDEYPDYADVLPKDNLPF